MRIIIVDDNTTNLALLCSMAGKLADVEVQGFTSSKAALANAQSSDCDLVIVDNIMPEIGGVELVTLLRQLPDYAHMPIVMVTADADRETRLAAIRAGANDFLAKPVDPVELRARITNLLAMRNAQRQLERRAEHLAAEVAAATEHLRQREEDMIYRLARAIDLRDNETGGHVVRVARVASLLAQELRQPEGFVQTLWLAAPLHDVGKIGIPDAILNKPGKLDEAEFKFMKQHTAIGASMLSGGGTDLAIMAEVIARGHHERWDGSGYPAGLKGETIPIAARITAVADVFDALCSVRPYKPAWPLEAARAEILRCSGTHFDPRCVAAFERAWCNIAPIYYQAETASNAA